MDKIKINSENNIMKRILLFSIAMVGICLCILSYTRRKIHFMVDT